MENINCWYDNWLEDYPVINKVNANVQQYINSQAKVAIL